MTKPFEAIRPETIVPNDSLLKKVQQDVGVNVNLCYQCSKCSAGCPMNFAMDYPPAQLLHAIRLGITDLVFHSKTMWMCASCETCTTRCPQEVDIAKVMDACKILALKQNIKPAIPRVHNFNNAVLRNMKWFGRVHELAAITDLKMRSFEFSKDVGLGIHLIFKGKFKLFPSLSLGRSASSVKIFSKSKKIEDQRNNHE
jgi:heterodisulfide reductase subunit C